MIRRLTNNFIHTFYTQGGFIYLKSFLTETHKKLTNVKMLYLSQVKECLLYQCFHNDTALDSGSSARKGMEVQVLSTAPIQKYRYTQKYTHEEKKPGKLSLACYIAFLSFCKNSNSEPINIEPRDILNNLLNFTPILRGISEQSCSYFI
jgi:hypothetical protein